jgi:hypothetical protein
MRPDLVDDGAQRLVLLDGYAAQMAGGLGVAPARSPTRRRAAQP